MTSCELPLFAVPALTPIPVVEPDERGVVTADVVIIGSGMGGGTMAAALAASGADILLVERGGFLPRELANWDPAAVFADGRYKNAEQWRSGEDGSLFDPGVYYYVGGNTKLYGAMLPRFRQSDFTRVRHAEGDSRDWPLGYEELEPFYAEAETLYGVRGDPAADPTEPWRSRPYPYPALPHEPRIAELADALAAQGLHPFSMPAGVDLRPGGRCVRCRTCDGFPCMVDAKADADVTAIRPAVQAGAVRLLTGTYVESLVTSADGGTVLEAVGSRDGRPVRIRGQRFVVAAGAVNTAALLLRSANGAHPHGLANSSGQVGRSYMVHNSTFFVGIDPRRRNETLFQKTLAWNDWYEAGPGVPFPLGNVQMLGKLQEPMVRSARRAVPRWAARAALARSVDLYLTSEDLASPENRIEVGVDGRIVVHWRPTNLRAHENLVRRTRSAVRRAGYPVVLTQRMGIETNSHQCGTAVMGADPATSVLDPTCKAHDVVNLWVADSSSFPSSAAVNPALTIAANALRVARKGGVVD